MPGKKSGLHQFLRFLGWFALVVVALELVLRLFGYGNYVSYRPDERLLWVPVPGHNVTEANHKPITISDDGFRYKQKLGPKQDGQVRVFAFGDSVTMGWEWPMTRLSAHTWSRCSIRSARNTISRS